MDPVHFTGKEILEIAVRIEENGLRFYTDAGTASKTTRTKELFRQLAEEERNHIRVFTDFKKLIKETAPDGPFDPDEADAPLYLRALADAEVMRPGEGGKTAERLSSERAVFDFAIQMEKDSLLFYYEMSRMIREKDKAVVDNLIEQEKSHLTRLSTLRDELFK